MLTRYNQICILKLLFFILLYGINTPAFAQEGWQWINPSPQGNDLNGVSFVDDNLGMAVGNAGMILKTTDGGQTWTILESNTREDLLAVSFVNANVAYVSGTSRTIMKTTDGGNSWINLSTILTVNQNFRCVHFVDTQVGWMSARNYMLKTLDGGNSWSLYRQYDPFDIYTIFALSADRCFWVGFGGINRTTNGGQSWTSASGVPYAYSYNDIFFINQNEGWTVGDGGVLLKTTDGGDSWIALPNLGFAYGGRLFFKNQNLGWVASYDGILKTTDGGNTWNLKSTATVAKFSFSMTNGFAVGQKGRIYKSTDEGNTWQSLKKSFAREINFKKIFFNDPQVGFILGDSGRVYRTNDSGLSWQTTQVLTSERLLSFFFTDAKTGWIGSNGLIFKTTNGIDWNLWYTTDNWMDFNNIRFYNSQIGCAVGYRIHITTDGGQNWQMKTISGDYNDYDLNSVYYITDQKIIAVGNAGKICYSKDAGATWSKITSPTSSNLLSVKFVDENVGFLITNDGVILKTTDAGLSWQLNYSTTSYYFNDLFVVGNQHLWVACQGKYYTTPHAFLKSSDGGSNWNAMLADNDFITTNFFFSDLNTGWLITEGACLLKYSDNLVIPSHPSNLIASASSVAINLSWQDNATNETGFKVYRSDHYSGAYKPIAELGADVNLYTDINVFPNIIYWYRVSSYNPIGESARSREDSVLISMPKPDTPALISPANNSTDQPVDLNFIWHRANYASSYHLQVSTDMNFSYKVVNDSSITDTLRRITSLSDHTTFYWRVRAKNTIGTSNWSEKWSFRTVIASPEAPVLSFPANGSTWYSTDLTLGWYASARAESYGLQVATASDFSSPFIAESGITSTTKQIIGLGSGTTYHWRVNASNAGGTSAWSTVWSFATKEESPSKVILVAPPNSAIINADSVRFIWRLRDPFLYITKFWFEIAMDSLMQNSVIDSLLTPSDTTKIVRGLAHNQSYWWQVKAKTAGGWSSFSEKYKFSIVLTGVREVPKMTEAFSLNPNYPNPFNPTTVIHYSIPKTLFVELSVFDVLGQELTILVNERQPAGTYQIQFDGQNLPAGLYFYRLRAGEFCATKKMVIVK